MSQKGAKKLGQRRYQNDDYLNSLEKCKSFTQEPNVIIHI